MRSRVLFFAALLIVAGSVFAVSRLQRHTAEHNATEQRLAQGTLTAMLDQETGLRGFEVTARQPFLEPYLSGRRDYREAAAALQAEISDRSVERRLLGVQDHIARTWSASADGQIRRTRGRTAALVLPPLSKALRRKALMDAFRGANARLQDELADQRQRELSRAGTLAVALIVGLCAALGGAALFAVRRTQRERAAAREAEVAYATSQGEFAETMQIIATEEEAHALIKRHVERSVDGAHTTVFNRNHSDDRLEATTPVPESSPLVVQQVTPSSCVAVRAGRPHERVAGTDPLVRCEVCGGSPGSTSCRPLLASGKVIGSVLTEHLAPLSQADVRRVRESVDQAAPVLANLRTIALAESRAATDVLTGLPNRRAVQDTVRRMTAQSGRSLAPLAALAIDLDHFKAINDLFGHEKGDDVLAAVGDVLRSSLRESDFAGRLGGEEFLVLAPATDSAGALVLADKLRAAIAKIEVPGVGRDVTASLGVACCPEHSVTAEDLLRKADRALYAAKAAGRDRVELVTAREGAASETVG